MLKSVIPVQQLSVPVKAQHLHHQSRSVTEATTKGSFHLSIVTQFYPPDYAATGQLIAELATQLGRQGMHVQVFTGQPGYAVHQIAPKFERSQRVSVWRTQRQWFWVRRIRGKVLRGLLFCLSALVHLFLYSNQADTLLFTTEPAFLPIIGYFYSLLTDKPYVCLLYDIYPDIAVKLGVISDHHWLVRCWEWLNHLAWRRAKRIIVLSPSMKACLVAKCPDIAYKVDVIHNWADPQKIVPIPKESNTFAQRHDLVEPFTVLYSGNMGRCHDMQTILEAARHIQHNPIGHPIRFVFVGDGAKRQECVDLVRRWGLQNCLFLPYQDKNQLPYSLTACDVSLVSVSPGMEELVAPSKLYGILSAGRPVAAICEPHSYLRKILHEGSCGKAFMSGDSQGLAAFIRELAQHPATVHQMSLGGRRYLEENFTPELIAQQYAVSLGWRVY